jgi:uncharacterized protein YfeS
MNLTMLSYSLRFFIAKSFGETNITGQIPSKLRSVAGYQ